MAYYEMRQALTQSVIDLALGLPIAHENKDFDPENDGGDLFLDLTSLFGEQNVISKDSVDESPGVYQISVYAKSGTGDKAILQTVDLILDNYRHGDTFTVAPQTIFILSASRNEGRNENGWYIIDLSIVFKSDIVR